MELAKAQRVVLQDIGHADLEEPSTGTQRRQAPWNELPGQGVEDHIDAFPAGDPHHLVGELQRTRVHHMLDALLLEECPLLRRPGRGEDLGTDVLRDLQRRLADAAGRGMNQDTLALAQPAEMMQGVVGGHERERDRDRLFEGDVRWLARDQRRVGRHVRAKTRRRQGNDIFANPQVLDARAGSDHGSRALPPEVE